MGVEGGGKPGDGNGMNRAAEKEEWKQSMAEFGALRILTGEYRSEAGQGTGTSLWLLFICYVMFNSLQPHGHARLHCLPEFAQIHVRLVGNAT